MSRAQLTDEQRREKRRQSQHAYYERNREAILARTSAAHRKRRATPEGRVADSERARERYYADPEKARKKARDWYHANLEKSRASARESNRRRRAARYGLSADEFDALLAKGCSICGAANGSHARSLHLDHDHITGKLRGALCHGCNVSLGAMQDDPTRLRAAAKYLEQHNS